jgi:hypothetical protein
MDFSEFRRRLGAEPRSQDPEFLVARDSSPEHRTAAEEAGKFEEQLDRALGLPTPAGLVHELCAVARQKDTRRPRWPLALAASLLVAVGAAGIGWKMNHSWDSVEDYVSDHYGKDGASLVAQSLENGFGDVHAVLAEFDLDAAPALAGAVRVVKFCPTPEGKGVHMVLETAGGPLTVIYMPGTQVTDREMLTVDGMEVMLVELETGSAAIIGPETRLLQDYYAVVHDSIVPLAASS